MIILDTNVVSEPMRPAGIPAVLDWLDRQAASTLFLTATSLSELMLGVEILPAGRQREELRAGLAELLDTLFANRILPFDAPAAHAFARLVAQARSAGRAISVADGQIAAIAAVHGFRVATRDRATFEAAGVPVIDPWTE